MIEEIINGKTYLLVEDHELPTANIHAMLVSGKSKIIGKASELTEAQWKEIVEQLDRSKLNLRSYRPTPLKNYNSDGNSLFAGDTTWLCWNATESGLSLISSIGMKPETTLIIL